MMAKYYTRIYLKRMAELLDLSEKVSFVLLIINCIIFVVGLGTSPPLNIEAKQAFALLVRCGAG